MSAKSERSRKCYKCGLSVIEDPNITLFRFPKPGKTNTLRCELWAKYCFPNGEWHSPQFQNKLYSEHRMLCNRHFQRTSFSDFPLSTKKLHRFAVPDDLKEVEPQPGPSHILVANITNLPSMDKTITHVQGDLQLSLGKENIPPIIVPDEYIVITEKPSSHGNIAEKIKNEKNFAKCRKHMKSICLLKKRINTLKNKALLQELNVSNSVRVLCKKLTPAFALLLQSQIKNFRKKTKGRRWTTEEKITALQLYKRSPTCYRLMRRLFYLPTPSTLKCLLSRFSLEVGINKPIFSVLCKATKNQKPSDNEYVLMFDEMSIKKNLTYNKSKDIIEGYQDHALQGRSSQVATHALVFMVAGLRKKVKQPIAYYLSSSNVTADRLSVLIKEILLECLQSNLSISATVCDMDGVNRRALAILGATVEKPVITINNIEIVTLFDAPHLLKCFRNLFLKYNIKCTTAINSGGDSGVGVAKWSHIQKFYELDNANPNFVFAPALKAEHLNPNSKQKMKVKLAAQVLSHTVAAGMMAKISDGQLSTEAAVTVNVIENMDKLFDAVNSDSKDLRRGKPYSTNLKTTTAHLELFIKMKKFFKTLQFLNCNRPPPSQDGWLWTLNAVEHIWRNLTKKHVEIRSLATRRLQQDPLENLFGCIRGNCGANYNPTANQFVAALKTAILTNLAHHSVGNCETDYNEAIINSYKSVLGEKSTNICTAASTSKLQNLSLSSDMPEELERFCNNEVETLPSGEIQACAYVCGFLVKKLNLDCINCKKTFMSEEKLLIEHLFVEFKEYTTKSSLKYCNKNMIDYVENCAIEANKLVKAIGHEQQVLKNVMQSLQTIDNSFVKTCPAHFEENVEFLLKTIGYICIKRFCTLKNREFGEEASRISLKRKIDILKHK